MLPHLEATMQISRYQVCKRISREALAKTIESDAGVICFKKSNLYRHGVQIKLQTISRLDCL